MRLADLAKLNAARAARRPIALVTDVAGGGQRIVEADALQADPLADAIAERFRLGKSGMVADGAAFVTVQVPPTRLVAIGAVHISQALATMARLAELDVTIVDPREAFATPERFPDVELLAEWPDAALPRIGLDRYTAVCLLTHDPKIDDPALVAALKAECFYIGALGSRKTHARRLERMREAGFDDAALARIQAPIGLDIGAVSPAEIAVAILGEIVAALRRKPRRDEASRSEAPQPERPRRVKFGRIARDAGEGAILAHSVRAPGIALKKGEIIKAAHIAALAEAGVDAIVAATLEPGDVTENVAAQRLAAHVAGSGVRLERPFTGRCNLMAEAAGLLVVDEAAVDAINLVDEAITVATLTPMRPVVAGEMIATVKIIPFAVPEPCLARSLAAAARPAVSVAPFRPLEVGVVSTLLPGLKPATVLKTLRLLDDRLALAGARITRETRVPHDSLRLAASLKAMGDVDVVVVFGASAITDRRDVIPVAIEAAGGAVDHLGMPVDPGNLLLLGRLGHNGTTVPVIGAPGCARSPKENGFDFVMWRLLAGLEVTGADLRRMGVGGLLSEIVSRPQPRQPDADA